MKVPIVQGPSQLSQRDSKGVVALTIERQREHGTRVVQQLQAAVATTTTTILPACTQQRVAELELR
jgi:hypothetical protein